VRRPALSSGGTACLKGMTQQTVPAEFLDRITALRHAAAEHAGRVPRRDIFALAKEFVGTPPEQIEAMLDHPDFDVRTGGVCIMDFQARRRSTTPERRQELCELYLRRHDRIDSWDLVDRAAPSVVGGYLFDRSRDPLYVLARSPHPMERRTAIVATYYFIRHGDLDDTFAIADLLAHDPDDLVQKAVGGWTREAGKRDRAPLRSFLDRHAATMPRTALRYAIEHLPEEERQYYLALGRTG
jgi:DNA alkylation repair enzyme